MTTTAEIQRDSAHEAFIVKCTQVAAKGYADPHDVREIVTIGFDCLQWSRAVIDEAKAEIDRCMVVLQ